MAAVSNPSVQLWSAPVTTASRARAPPFDRRCRRRASAAPRSARDRPYLSGVARWRRWTVAFLRREARELWKPSQGAVVGAAAISPDDERFAFRCGDGAARRCIARPPMAAAARAVAESLDVRGAASWSPDGKWIAIAARNRGRGRAYSRFPSPAALRCGWWIRFVQSRRGLPTVDSSCTRELRAPASVPVKAVTPDGKPFPFPRLSVDRDGDSYRFLPDAKQLVVKQGGFRRQDFWLLDLATGARRQLTRLKPGESIQRFDVSPDGKRVVFERVRENSDIVLIEIPPR